MTNLPTYEQILERVKAQEWEHRCKPDDNSSNWEDICFHCGEEWGLSNVCPVRIAQAIQAAMVEALRWAENYELCSGQGMAVLRMKIGKAADSLEKSPQNLNAL